MTKIMFSHSVGEPVCAVCGHIVAKYLYSIEYRIVEVSHRSRRRLSALEWPEIRRGHRHFQMQISREISAAQPVGSISSTIDPRISLKFCATLLVPLQVQSGLGAGWSEHACQSLDNLGSGCALIHVEYLCQQLTAHLTTLRR